MTNATIKGFYAYPASPSEIGQTIEEAKREVQSSQSDIAITTWKTLDIVGNFISGEVLQRINSNDFLMADISSLNFNVTYEIGYAIGKQKRILLTKNRSLTAGSPTIQEVGIFDTIGYKEYQNSIELASYIKDIKNINPIDTSACINTKAPVYLLATKYKTDWATKIVARIKKARYIFRTFDPDESPRLSAYDAIKQVSQSYGVVVPLLSSNTESHQVHNLRGAFIAGLADGMNKALCIIQHGNEPVPIDYRDFVKISNHPNDIDDFIAEFASEVAEFFQQEDSSEKMQRESFLQKINLGSTSAENEMKDLADYYLKTDQYLKSLRGEAHLVVGRKGSGKSAIFLQIRDKERNKNGNIVLDLNPDGYKLVKFKEQILQFLEEGTYQHTITAFWEYVLLLEICYKILEKDLKNYIHDHSLFEPYKELSSLYKADGYDSEGDFSERMSSLMEKIYSEYQAKYKDKNDIRLSAAQVTELIYKHDVKELRTKLISYIKHKKGLWLLFDNIDKGWPTSGLQHKDLLIIRALIEATRKIERLFDRNNSLKVITIVFLRNDVYELLVRETSDRGKEASVSLDWTDYDLLRELIRLRIASNNLDENISFEAAWLKIFISHYHGEETSQYLIDRSLMRPRFLLNLINHCKSFAINLNHEKIEAEDIKKGLSAYSSDLLTDIGYELKDVFCESTDDILYAFIGCKKEMSTEEIKSLLTDFGLTAGSTDRIFELLLWYGFLGVRVCPLPTTKSCLKLGK